MVFLLLLYRTKINVIMKTTKIIFSTIMFFICLDFVSYLPSAINHIRNGGNEGFAWFCKMLIIVATFGMGLLFFQLQNRFSKIGYLDEKGAFWLKTLAFLCLFMAVISSLQDAVSLLWRNGIAENQSYVFIRAFFAHLFVRTPIYVIFSLFLFLFSSFVQKASRIKAENESFI